MKKYIIAIILGLSAGVSAFTQPWSLEECVAYALEHNPEVARLEIASRQYRSRLAGECLDMLPTFSANIGDNLSALSVSGEMVLFQGFTKHFQRQSAKLAYDMSVLETLGIKEDLAIRVIESYLQLAQAFQQLDYARAGYEASLQERDKTSLLVTGGSQPMSALMQVEAQLASDRSSMVEAECAVKSRRLELCQAMDLPYDSGMSIRKDEMSDSLMPPPLCTAEDIRAAVERNPKYRRSETAIRQREAAFAGSIGSLSPTLSLRAEYCTPVRQTAPLNTSYAGLNISMPVFGNWRRIAQIAEARHAVRQARMEAYATRRELESALERAVIESSNSYSKSAAALENVKALKESLRINRLKYEQGLITVTDYTLAKSEYDKALSAFLKARWQYVFQLKVIDYYMSDYCYGQNGEDRSRSHRPVGGK